MWPAEGDGWTTAKVRSDYDVLTAPGRSGLLDGKAHCCFCSAVKFQGKNAAACSGGLAPVSAQAVR